MQSFKHRSNAPELMDDGAIGFDEFHQCLQQLETINHFTFSYRPTLIWIDKCINKYTEKCTSMSHKREEPIRILDVGCGGGDMLRQLDKRSSRYGKKISFQLIGVDLNPHAKKYAERISTTTSIRYETADVFAFESNQPIDFIISSLFTHHLSDVQIIGFLRWLDFTAKRGWFINDLHRHPVPYYFIKATTGLLSKNRLIRHDAAVSIARAFTKTDWQRLLDAAGVEGNVEVKWFFPFRICLSCEKK